MTVVWRGAPLALLQRYGRTPKADLNDVLLTMGMADGARYLIREYDLPLTEAEYYDVMRDVIAQLYETVDLKPGVRTLLAKLQAEGAGCACAPTPGPTSAAPCSPGWASQTIFPSSWRRRACCTRAARRCSSSACTGWAGPIPAACAVCEDAIYAASTAHKAGFTVLGVQDAASADDAPAMAQVVRPVPAGLDRTGLDKDLRNFSAKNTPVFPLWEHRRAVISGCISAAAPIAGRRPARHPPARGGWRCGPRCACAAPRQKAGPPRQVTTRTVGLQKRHPPAEAVHRRKRHP